MRFRGAVLVAAGAAVVACGLEVVGNVNPIEAPPDAGVTPVDVSSDDAAAPEPERIGDGGEATTDAAPIDETPLDAGPVVDAGPCGPSVLVDNFAQGLGKWTHYGGVEQRTQGNNAYARLIAEGVPARAAGLFWVPTVKATAFKAKFAYYVRTSDRYWYMGDGITFTWLTSTGGTTLGTNATSGQGLGLQPGVAGYAFALDGWQNSSIGDLDAPSFSFLHIDPARGSPGSYGWHVSKRGPFYRPDVYEAWRTIELTVANGRASALFRFSPNGTLHSLIENVPVDTSTNVVAMGFTASTGGADAMGFFVDTVSFELTNATCN